MVASLFGILSIIFPAFFNNMADEYIIKTGGMGLQSDFVLMSGRAYGLYLQANVLGTHIYIFALLFACFYKTKFAITQVLALNLASAMIVLTASRSATVAFAAFALALYIYYLIKGMPLKDGKTSSFVSLLLLNFIVSVVGSIVVFVALGSILFSGYADRAFSSYDTPLERMTKFVTLDDSISQDASLNARVGILSYYASQTMEYPVFGQGTNSMQSIMLEQGTIGPHNEFLRMSTEYGIPYTLLFIIYMTWLTLFKKGGKMINMPPAYLIFGICMLISCLASHNMLNTSSYYFLYYAIIAARGLQMRGNIDTETYTPSGLGFNPMPMPMMRR